MKVISLNTWGGRAGKEKLLDFFRHHKDDTDVFCLQEIWSAPYEHLDGHAAGGKAIDHSEVQTHGLQEISAVLSNHNVYFRPHYLDNYGLLLLVKKNLDVIEEGERFVYKNKGDVLPQGSDIGNHPRNIQYVQLKVGDTVVTCINFHGLWNRKGKTDSEDRMRQSENIIAFLHTLKNPYILCGDFNLLPETQSLKLFEAIGLSNLIKEYGITSTRSSHYIKPEKYADYMLVSSGINVTDFGVLNDEVSDHLPLLLEFELKK